jgi:hypothetical protein
LDTQPTSTEIVGYHPAGARHYVTIGGFFPPARSLFERLQRAYYAFVGHVPIYWAIEKETVAKIVARFNVDKARASGEEGTDVLHMDTDALNKELTSTSCPG